MARVRLDFDGGPLEKRLRNIDSKIERAVSMTIDRNAAWGQAYMRTNAPWTDRTGAARGGLMALPAGNEILLSYSVYYGIWLEIAHSGEWQILIPSMRIIGEHLMRDLKDILGKL